MRKPVERLEGRVLAAGEDDPGSRNPVRLFPIDQMTDHVERAPRIRTLGSLEPRIGEIGQERPKRGWCPAQQDEGVGEVEVHHGFLRR
jgi:hypothetical protein